MTFINTTADFNKKCEKKYELIQDDEAKKLGLYRIKALREFGGVKKGDLGGLVSGEHNLSHEGLCWIDNTSRVSDNAYVSGNAQIMNGATIREAARISGAAVIERADIGQNLSFSGQIRVSAPKSARQMLEYDPNSFPKKRNA